MSDCRRIAGLITSYVDKALEGEARAQVERHVAECPPCRGQLAREQGVHAALRRCAGALTDQPLPPGLEARCRAMARDITAPRTSTFLRGLIPAGVIAALLLAVAVFLLPTLTARSTTLLAAQLTADHVKCFSLFAPRAATGGDAGTAERQLASYGWQMHVPPSAPEAGLRLLGVRRCVYADGRIPHVMYEANGKPLSLFKLDGIHRPEATVTSMGHECRLWQRDGHTFVLVGPEDSGPELARIARYVREEAR